MDSENPIDDSLRNIADEDELREAYSALSGEIHASLSSALMRNSNLLSDAVLQRLAVLGSRKVPSNYGLMHGGQDMNHNAKPAFGPNDWWTQAMGSFYEQDADGHIGTDDLEQTNVGFLIGVDHSGGGEGGGEGGGRGGNGGAMGRDSEGWAIGFAFGMIAGETDIDGRHSSAETETWAAGMYGSARFDLGEETASPLPLDISYGLFGAFHSIETNRSVLFDSFDEHLTADYEATSFQVFGEIGSRFEITNNIALRPFAGVSHVSLATDGFTETPLPGSTSYSALTSQSDTLSLTTTTLGWRSETTIKLPGSGERNRQIKLNGMVGWRHDFGDYEPGTVLFFEGSDPFTITGSPLAEDTLVTGMTISAEIAPNFFASATHVGHLSETSQAHEFAVGLSVRF